MWNFLYQIMIDNTPPYYGGLSNVDRKSFSRSVSHSAEVFFPLVDGVSS